MKKIFIFLIVLLSFLSFTIISTSAIAAPNPYSDCGIGAALFPEHHVGAVLSNILWDSGSTAITSALSSPGTCEGKKADAAAYIFRNYEMIAEETARGDGDHLTSLLNILEVKELRRDEIVLDVRSKVSHYVASDSYLGDERLKKSKFYYKSLISTLENTV